MSLRPCKHCHHSRARHIFENDDWDCMDCDCHYFQDTPTRQANGFLSKSKAVELSQSERAILIHLIRQSDLKEDMRDLIERLK